MIRRGFLLIALLAAFALPEVFARPSVAVAFGITHGTADFLYAQPVDGLTPAGLSSALGRLGFAADDVRSGGVRIEVDDTLPQLLAARVAATGLVRSVEADAVVRATQLPPPGAASEEEPAAFVPNDVMYPDQASYLEAIGAPQAWADAAADGIDTGNVLIAVVDSGVDYDHPDLAPRIAANPADTFFDGIDNDGNGCVDDVAGCNFVSLDTADPACGYGAEPPHWRTLDDEGHGTFVAGLAAAVHSNETGIAGVAPGARILPVKVLDCTATGRISDAVAGIRYAADMGADVINISFGAPNDSPALRDAIVYAQAAGAVVVASAGNDGNRGITFPAAYPGVLSVAASGVAGAEGVVDYGLAAPFAQFGPGIDFLAPGVDVLSTVPTDACDSFLWECVEEGYARGSGSSFATPVVAGAVALLLADHPGRSADFVQALLLRTSHPQLPAQEGRLLDLGAAMEREIVTAGAPGTSHASGGTPPGPAPN